MLPAASLQKLQVRSSSGLSAWAHPGEGNGIFLLGIDGWTDTHTHYLPPTPFFSQRAPSRPYLPQRSPPRPAKKEQGAWPAAAALQAHRGHAAVLLGHNSTRAQSSSIRHSPLGSRAELLHQLVLQDTLCRDPRPNQGQADSRFLPGEGGEGFTLEVFGSTGLFPLPHQQHAGCSGSLSPTGRSFSGPVGGLVPAWSQRIDVEDSPSQFKSKMRFTASTFLKTSAMIEHRRYTAEEAGLSPLLPPSSQEQALGREKGTACCFYRLYVCLLIAPWHLMFTAGFL